MDSKLTLKLDNSVIEQAKIYARNKNISLSRLIENYLKAVTLKKEKTSEISPLVESLTGVIEIQGNLIKDYSNYLSEKYS